MGKLYFRLMFIVFWIALLAGGAIRVYHKLYYVDLSSGFYHRNTPLISLFNGILLVSAVFLLLTNRLKSTENDYPIVRRSRPAGVLAAITGLSVLLYTAESAGFLHLSGNSAILLTGTGRIISIVLGLLAAFSLIWLGIYGMMGHTGSPGAIIALIPAVWQVVLLVIRFNSYATITTISDNLLAVLFMVAASIFVVGNARTTCGMARKDGRNYIISTGLYTALTGFLLTIPGFIYMAVCKTTIAAPFLGWFESIYVFFMSCYALISVYRLRRSIVYV